MAWALLIEKSTVTLSGLKLQKGRKKTLKKK